MNKIHITPHKQEQKLIGVDVYLDNAQDNIEKLANVLVEIEPTLKLHMITQKGLKVWPDATGINSNDILCFRFFGYEDTGLTQQNIVSLLGKITEKNYDILSTQNLYSYDGKIGFTLAQGE
jgi:isocitrate dehydrogenase